MLFMNVPKAQQHSQKVEMNDVNKQQQQQEEERDTVTISNSNPNAVSSQLQIKSSSVVVGSSPEECLDREVVLRRIRHHKCKNKVKSAFQALVGNGASGHTHAHAHAHAQDKWMELGDAFTCP